MTHNDTQARLRAIKSVIFIIALLTASCATAPIEWAKPGGTRDQWIKDKVACQYKARREAEKRYRETSARSASSVFADDTLSRNLDQYDAKRTERRLFEECLAGRGYAKMKATPKKN